MKETSKQSEIKRRMHKAYERIDKTRDQYECQGCHRTDRPLSHFHTISVADCKGLGNWDLIAADENIELECFGDYKSCHNIWESGSVERKIELKNFERRMDLLAEHDPRRYNAMVVELDELSLNKLNYELITIEP